MPSKPQSMLTSLLDHDRMRDKVKLTLRVSYISSLIAFIFGLLCLYLMDITVVVPYVFMTFAFANLINALGYRFHQNLSFTYNIISITGLISALIITLFTGGINSPFIFILAIVVFAGYISTRNYGRIYLYISFLLVILIYTQGISNFSFTQNVVPPESQNLFSFLSVMFSVYLLGGVLGKNLLKAHHNLFKAQVENEKRLKEKETLLKEVHHRVKNNLQTVSSLLSMQSRSVENERFKELIKSSQNRVISMAMVHEMLYMRDDITKVQYRSYVQELGEYLVRSVKGGSHKINLKIDIPDIELGIDTAIPLGLLINEAITNSLKYGIKDNEGGEIYVYLRQEEDKKFILEIGDDGAGFPTEITPKTTQSLGLKLIHNLARQLKGSISRDVEKKGTNYTIHFEEVDQEFHSVM